MKILIAGAGIGGLTAALCLEQAGHDVLIFEQADELLGVGAGIQCGANAVRVFQYLGLQSKLEPVAVQPESVEFRDYLSGASLYEVPLGASYTKKYGAPYYHLHRADLMRVLLDEVQRRRNIKLSLSARILSFIELQNHVELNVHDGSCHKGDLLVGCDGIKSSIRTQLFGDSSARFTGNVAWRATVPVNKLPDNFMQKVTTNFVGPKKHMVLYYLSDMQIFNMVGVVENSIWRDDSWVSKASWRELASDFSGWHPMVTTLVNALDQEACYRWALYDHKPMRSWSSNRVTLLGDAAHATLPFMASGAAMAIEDARILQRCLDAEHQVSSALSRYQKNRMSRTAKIQNTSRKLGALYHFEHRILRKGAFSALRLMSDKKEDFLPLYDANNVPLK